MTRIPIPMSPDTTVDSTKTQDVEPPPVETGLAIVAPMSIVETGPGAPPTSLIDVEGRIVHGEVEEAEEPVLGTFFSKIGLTRKPKQTMP